MRRYVLLDANIVAAYFIPEAIRSKTALRRTEILIEAVRKRAVDDIELLLPNICIPEVFGVFAKYAYGKYNKQVTRTIDTRRYRTAREKLREYIHNGAVLHQYELNRYHILATDLIAPIDHRFQIRKKKRFNPMSATDHLVVAMGIVLARLHGQASVVVFTGDRRMADAVQRATKLKRTTVDSMRLAARAEELGYEWGHQLFPRVINLVEAKDQELELSLGRWPLPTKAPRGSEPRATARPRRRR